MKYYIKNGIVNVIYTGITENPPVEISNNFKLSITETNRNPGIEKKLYHSDNDTFYTPWANVDKRTIAKMYIDDDLLDSLFTYTRSCEYDPTSEYFENIKDPGTGHCGECWWCEERQWAFGRLD